MKRNKSIAKKDEYIPTALRQEEFLRPEPRPEAWAVGLEHDIHEHGMTDGPFPTEEEALETVGERKARIVHFFSDGTHEIVWAWHKDRWVRICLDDSSPPTDTALINRHTKFLEEFIAELENKKLYLKDFDPNIIKSLSAVMKEKAHETD